MANLLKKLCNLGIILTLVGCNSNINPFSSKKSTTRSVETLDYSADPTEEIINFNATDGTTVVMMGKYLPDNEEYAFMYQLRSGIWIGTNSSFALGDTLTLDQMCLTTLQIPTMEGNPNKKKQ